jgi:hypothetical protein
MCDSALRNRSAFHRRDTWCKFRVEKARELIERFDYSLKEVAELVGFKSIHHFTRVFHKTTSEPRLPGAASIARASAKTSARCTLSGYPRRKSRNRSAVRPRKSCAHP